MTATSELEALVAAELAEPVDPVVATLAEAIVAHVGPATRAVLFYGSCLRERQFDGLMLDFYVLVSDYAAAYPARWMATANRLIPPNVFPFEANGLTAKYAVLSEDDFARLASSRTRNVSVWARFAQPSRLVWVADEAARGRTIQSVASAPTALLSAAAPLYRPSDDPLDRWRQAFALTYAAELRAERGTRAASVVDSDPERFRRFIGPVLAAADIPAQPDRKRGEAEWRRRRIEGKAMTLLRLAKASATFAGGIDYLAWKIGRHSGARIEIRPWQRRWPILGAITLLPRLLARGAVR